MSLYGIYIDIVYIICIMYIMYIYIRIYIVFIGLHLASKVYPSQQFVFLHSLLSWSANKNSQQPRPKESNTQKTHFVLDLVTLIENSVFFKKHNTSWGKGGREAASKGAGDATREFTFRIRCRDLWRFTPRVWRWTRWTLGGHVTSRPSELHFGTRGWQQKGRKTHKVVGAYQFPWDWYI